MDSENKCKPGLEHSKDAVLECFKDAVKSIIKNHYGDTVRIDFDNLMICVNDRCVKYATYYQMVLALVIVDHFMKKLPDIGSNPSEKSLNTSQFQ